jgi:hypothetical protein
MPGNRPADSEDIPNKAPDRKKGHTSYQASFINDLKKHLQIDTGLKIRGASLLLTFMALRTPRI